MRDYNERLLGGPIDVSKEFVNYKNNYFNGMRVIDYNKEKKEGLIQWDRYARKARIDFSAVNVPQEPSPIWEFPPEYEENPILPFTVDFITKRTVRLRISTNPYIKSYSEPEKSLMLINEPEYYDEWEAVEFDGGIEYKSQYGSFKITYDPFHFEINDANNKLLTKTQHFNDTKALVNTDPTPFSFVRKYTDLKRYIAATFTLSPDEKIYGCGESFTRLNKRGQKIVLATTDAHGVQTNDMYKPIPFFMSSRGYGMFVHTSTPTTFDFGCDYDQANTIFCGDHELDLFIFIGEPKDILSEYVELTGKSPTPPLWSFGLWMSRITYKSEKESRDVAAKLRESKIPCDVIHLDTGWFETDWRCDYKFSHTRFDDPKKMIDDLREKGFRISLWQLPYFTPKNELYEEIIQNGYAVLDADGILAVEDAIIDFSNEEAVRWYQELLKGLLKMGVSAIKVDFGEAAPYHGAYKSGKSGFYEHNLYPLRYNKAVADITKEVTGENIIWARSTWAGSQRYPLHWGGDEENTDCAMAASLRAGLSLGLCGFTYWSHDIGGFVEKSPEELYRRWMPFGMLTSHSRCHGQPPKEPWGYSDEFVGDFRKAVELKYKLMPYIYTQAVKSSDKGYPMLRTLFFEYPEDSTAWLIEDEYLFGENMLVAPLFEENTYERKVYIPKGKWIDYQTNKIYEGEKWYNIEAGEIPIIILVKDGSIIPHVDVVQSTDDINWEKIKLNVYSVDEKGLTGYLALPEDEKVHAIEINKENQRITTDLNINFKIKI